MANPNLPSVQTPLVFTSPDPRAARQLKDRLERQVNKCLVVNSLISLMNTNRCLREALMQMRPKQPTVLNFPGNAVLRKLLPTLESSHGQTSSQDHLDELQRISKSHKICGFPLHFAFSDKDRLIEALKSTGVHLTNEPRTEFALAVHVEAYANNVMSVWLYIASMVKRR